jgi:hypothetical protein
MALRRRGLMSAIRLLSGGKLTLCGHRVSVAIDPKRKLRTRGICGAKMTLHIGTGKASVDLPVVRQEKPAAIASTQPAGFALLLLLMSAFGTKRTWRSRSAMSAFGGKRTVRWHSEMFAFDPSDMHVFRLLPTLAGELPTFSMWNERVSPF